MDHVRNLVAAGGVSVVLAQDRDRFAREPAYHYLLQHEFEEHVASRRVVFWTQRAIRDRIIDGVYRPHTYEETRELVSPEVASKLDPGKRYGIWWFNRRRYLSTQVGEVGPDGERRYRRHIRLSDKPARSGLRCRYRTQGYPVS